jgi:hypothetical protein
VAAATEVFVLDLGRAAAFARLPTAARALLRLCDGTRTVAAVCAASALPAARALEVLDRLHDLGLIAPTVPVSPAPTPPPNLAPALPASPAFTPEEEQFFASSLDHLVDDR